MITSAFFFSVIDISKVQDDEVGDGTTSVVVLACELLKVRMSYFRVLKVITDFEWKSSESTAKLFKHSLLETVALTVF